MDDDANARLRSLIETGIPDGRAGLENSYANLERVAAYCEANYAQALDKKAAFDETRRYTVQSLASVAYQVNTLACALLHTLDLQTDKITEMGSQVHNVSEEIEIHKEKVARREIGVLTVNKSVQKQPKIIASSNQERPQRYQRTPIDYSLLDGLGHGVKTPDVSSLTKVSRVTSSVSGSSSAHCPVFPNYEHLLPKANINATLSRSSIARSEHYRTPQIAWTPIIDPQRFSSVTQATNYGSTPSASEYGTVGYNRDSNHSMPLPPPQLASVAQYRLSTNSVDGLPPPPASALLDDEPLPPPPNPVTMHSIYDSNPLNAQSPMNMVIANKQQFNMTSPFDRSMDWIPKVYLEKAIALYDYDAEKPDELTLRENCVVYILRKNDDGWFEGVLNRCTGLFPGNYVQTIN